MAPAGIRLAATSHETRERRFLSRRRLRYLLPSAAFAVTLGGGGFAALETNTVGSFGDGLWWALSLVTTVGFVGPTPVTTGGRLIAGALMLLGFALLSLTAAALASLFVRDDEIPAEQRDAAFESLALAELRALRARLDHIEQQKTAPSGRSRVDAGRHAQRPSADVDGLRGRERPAGLRPERTQPRSAMLARAISARALLAARDPRPLQ